MILTPNVRGDGGDALKSSRPHHRVLFLLCLPALFASCSPPSTSSQDPPDAGMSDAFDASSLPSLSVEETITQLTDLQVRHACQQIFVECPARAYGDLPFVSRHLDLSACLEDEHQLLRDFLTERYTRFVRLIDANEMRFDGAMAHQCVESSKASFEDDLCQRFVLQDASCDRIFTGLRLAGDACVHQDECSSGMSCEESFEQLSCSGLCTACGLEACEEGEYCERGGGRSRCEVTSDLGEACSGDSACGDTRSRGCLDTGQGGRCIELGSMQSGEPCSDDTHCVRGAMCDEGRCVEVRLRQRDEPCALTSPRVGLCSPGLVCVASSPMDPPTCQDVREAGQFCTSLLQCAPGLHCEEAQPGDWRSGSCQPLQQDGERCKLPFDCVSKRCIIQAPLQGVCSSDFSCE